MLVIRRHFDAIPSTQDYARDHLHETSPQRCFLYTADEQTDGRGTKQRIWSSSKLNLQATYTFYFPKAKRNLFFNLPQVVGLSVAQVLEGFGLKEVEVKWVNDVLIQRKKVCGILCESGPSAYAEFVVAIIGIGLNVNMDESDCKKISQPVTSMKIALGQPLEKEAVLKKITDQLLVNLPALFEQGFAFFQSDIMDRLAFKNEMIHFEADDKIFHGMLEGVDGQGMLLIRQEDQIEKFFNGRILR